MPAPPTDADVGFMRRAIRLAMNGRGLVEPNPMVGCVIVRDGRVIGEGHHEQFGGPHAEPNALAACIRAGEPPAGATAYVTLEPCCHTNKKTPPCAPRLIAANVARVVVGCPDPNPEVNGKGLAKLRAAGIEVVGPILEDQAKQLIAPFLARVTHRRPYVTMKWAESADGKVAGPSGRPFQIGNATSARAVHGLRARSDAILVGIATVRNDDPLLTVRGATPLRPLRRVVLDSGLNLPITSRLVATASEHPLVVFCSDAALRRGGGLAEAAAELKSSNVDIRLVEPGAGGGVSLPAVLAELGRSDVTHLLVEPGPTLARAFIGENLVDRVWVSRSPCRIDDLTAPSAATVPADYLVTGKADLDGDRLTEYLNPRSEAYFGPQPSADFVRTS